MPPCRSQAQSGHRFGSSICTKKICTKRGCTSYTRATSPSGLYFLINLGAWLYERLQQQSRSGLCRSGLWELGNETTTPMSALASPLNWINCQFIHHQNRAEPAVNGPQYFRAAWRSGGCLCMCSSVCCTQFAYTECSNTMLLKNVCVQFAVHVAVLLNLWFFQNFSLLFQSRWFCFTSGNHQIL